MALLGETCEKGGRFTFEIVVRGVADRECGRNVVGMWVMRRDG